MAMSITPTVYADPPRVDLVLTGMPATTARVRVYRKCNGQDLWVRGGTQVVGVAGRVMDWEVPCGRLITYWVYCVSSAGATLESKSVTVATVPDVPMSSVWLSDPLDQTSPMLVTALAGTDDVRTYPANVSRAVGSATGRARLSVGTREALPAFRLTILAEGADRAAVRALVTGSVCLLVRAPVAADLPPLIYGVPAEPQESVRAYAAGAPATWDLTLTTSGGPALDVMVPAWTYGDLKATGALYSALSSSWSTYLDLSRGPV